jgi:hypothetical protein
VNQTATQQFRVRFRGAAGIYDCLLKIKSQDVRRPFLSKKSIKNKKMFKETVARDYLELALPQITHILAIE